MTHNIHDQALQKLIDRRNAIKEELSRPIPGDHKYEGLFWNILAIGSLGYMALHLVLRLGGF